MSESIPEQIGREYLNGEYGHENGRRIRDAYRDLAAVNDMLFEAIPVDVVFTETDPYQEDGLQAAYQAMRDDIENNGRIKIFSGGTHPDFLTRRENIVGRAVHDYWGHYHHGVGFTFDGEFQKWYHMRDHYPRDAAMLLFSEVVGQTSAVMYLGGFTDDFEQRGVFPRTEWVRDAYRKVMS